MWTATFPMSAAEVFLRDTAIGSICTAEAIPTILAPETLPKRQAVPTEAAEAVLVPVPAPVQVVDGQAAVLKISTVR